MPSIQIPFAGFYESIPSAQIDDVVNQAFDYEGTGCPDIPEEFWHHWGKGNKAVEIAYCKLYVQKFVQYLKDNTTFEDFELNLEFEELTSPKYYNFETDRIFCTISFEDIKKLYDHVNTPALRTMVRERHSSRSGFISFYEADYDDPNSEWQKPVTQWDSVQLQTLLMAFMDQEGIEEDTYAIMEDCSCNGQLDDVVWSNCSKECLAMVNKYDEAHRG
jgi:hypothetical protein